MNVNGPLGVCTQVCTKYGRVQWVWRGVAYFLKKDKNAYKCQKYANFHGVFSVHILNAPSYTVGNLENP